jgi:hypothetical protein
MANFGNANTGFFGGGATGGGGGGISGSGTTNKLPKWASSSSLTDSQLFDNGTSVGVGTTSPTSGFLFDVNTSGIFRTYLQVGTATIGTGHTGNLISDGTIEASVGVNIAPVNVALNKTGFYWGSNSMTYWAGNNQIGRIGLNSNNGEFLSVTATFSTTIIGGTGTLNSLRVQSGVRPALDTNNTTAQNQIVIDPVINQVNGTGTGSGILRGVYYNPTTTALGGSTHIAWQNTSGDIIFGNLKDNVNSTNQVAMVDLDGKVVRQSSLTSFNLYQSGSTPNGISIDFATSTYKFGLDASARAALEIVTDEFKGKYASSIQGIHLDFGNYGYTFGQIDDGTSIDVKHFVDGTSGAESAYFKLGANRIGYEFDFGATKTYKFGDFLVANATGSIEIDTTNSTMLFKGDQNAGSTTFEANSLVFTGANIEDAGFTPSGTPTYLVITLNSVQYRILCEQ